MPKINISTTIKKINADLYTPVGIYLRMRDKFRDTILLESTDSLAGENSRSIIAINAIAGIEITDFKNAEFKYPAQNPERIIVSNNGSLQKTIDDFAKAFDVNNDDNKIAALAQGLYGYCTYDAVQFFEQINFNAKIDIEVSIPLIRYRMYQYVIVIDHFKDEIYLCENLFENIESDLISVESILRSKDVPSFPFCKIDEEATNITNEAYCQMVEQGIAACKRGDVFQIVLSRAFNQKFTGDDFNVYRSLRNINPGPYLFYFDYGDYKLFGSSPESQVVITDDYAVVNPIAGTIKRTGNDEGDTEQIKKLESDVKENAEHVMLVDLARNDLSTLCNNVEVAAYKKIKRYAHLIHMVSEVKGKLLQTKNPFKVLSAVFPAGTLSGAPKYKAMQLIDKIENNNRSYYGGTIGYIGLNGNCNHAIMIRSFLSKNNTLHYRAGAGVVVSSVPANELEEVNIKLAALKQAIVVAEKINN
jgi:anthranilate synthase component I